MLYVDGQQVAQGYLPKTVPFVAGGEGTDVRLDAETPVWEYHNPLACLLQKLYLQKLYCALLRA